MAVDGEPPDLLLDAIDTVRNVGLDPDRLAERLESLAPLVAVAAPGIADSLRRAELVCDAVREGIRRVGDDRGDSEYSGEKAGRALERLFGVGNDLPVRRVLARQGDAAQELGLTIDAFLKTHQKRLLRRLANAISTPEAGATSPGAAHDVERHPLEPETDQVEASVRGDMIEVRIRENTAGDLTASRRHPYIVVLVVVGVISVVVGLVSIVGVVGDRNGQTPPATGACEQRNLLDCSIHIPVFVPGESSAALTATSDGLRTEFENRSNGSGLALQFRPPLDVSGSSAIELRVKATRSFSFLVEYKVRTSQPPIVKTSVQQAVRGGSDTRSLSVPISYAGTLDEIVLNFATVGEASQLVITSLLLR